MAKSIIAVVLALGLGLSATTGCIGGNALTGKVREFNLRVAKGKWPREAVFLLLQIIPVYGFAAMADLFVINGIEFHTGTNPVSGKPRIARVGETRQVEAPDGSVSRSTLREDGSIDFVITGPDGVTHLLNLSERGDRLVARDGSGRELASVPRDAGTSLP
jgi:Domain of unknown function (DUF3332)